VSDEEEVVSDGYLEKRPSAGRMGKAVELLVAAACILISRGELNASMALVDDEGVDLVFHRVGGSATLAVQVKARMSSSKRVSGGGFVAFVRSQTFRPREDLFMLFITADVDAGTLGTLWFVPSTAFAAAGGKPNARGRLKFAASLKEKSKDQWRTYRLEPTALPGRVLDESPEARSLLAFVDLAPSRPNHAEFRSTRRKGP